MIDVTALVFDVVIVLVLVASLFIGKAVGLLRSLYFLCIIIIAVVLANFISPVVDYALEKSNLGEKIENAVFDAIFTEEMRNSEEGNSAGLDEILDGTKLPDSAKNYISEKLSLTELKGQELCKEISKNIATIAINVIGKILTVLAVIIILSIISLILKVFTKLPVIAQIDGFGGAIIGLTFGFLIVAILCAVVYGTGLSHGSTTLTQISSHSYVIKIFDKIGFFAYFIR